MDILLQLLVYLAEAAWKAIKAANRRRELRRRGLDPDAIEADDGESAAEVAARVEAELAEAKLNLGKAARAGEATLSSLDSLERRLRDQRGGGRLAALVRDQVRASLSSHLERLVAVVRELESLPPAQAQRLLASDGTLGTTHHAVRLAVVQTAVIDALCQLREDREEALRLADAEAIAASMLRPVQQFAAAHQLGLAEQHPLAVRADPGREAIWLGLLPEGHPVLFVPADFERDLYRCASIPHELGHLLWRDAPGLAEEAADVFGYQHHVGLIAVRQGQVVGTLDQLFTAWLPELWADAIAVLLLGPAALRGLAHSFASPEHPQQVLVAGAQGRAYDEHPPAHLRVHLAGHLCWLMGFDQEAKLLLAEWDRAHGNPEQAPVAVEGGAYIRVDWTLLIESGKEALGKWHDAQFSSLAGLRLGDVPGMEMSPGLWARAQRRAEDLANGVPFNDDGRIVLAAAIEAFAQNPALADTIAQGLRRAVLGRDMDEARVADAAYTGPKRKRSPFAQEVRDALVLREILDSPGGLARRHARERASSGR